MRIHTRLRIALVALAMSKLPRWNKVGAPSSGWQPATIWKYHDTSTRP